MPARQPSLPTGSMGRKLPQRKPTTLLPDSNRTLRESTSTTSESTRHDRILSTLNHVIQSVDLASSLVPIDLAQGVLGSISALLTLIKTTIQNKEDFSGIAERCDKISMMLLRVTSGRTVEEINPATTNAITELSRSIDTILAALKKKVESNIGSQAFHAELNKEQIAEWQSELDHFLTLFNTEINLASNIKMDELIARFDELRDKMSAQSITEVAITIPVPPRPTIFVGREDIVQEAIQQLLQRKHAALLGPGGMGKTFIARAILNDPTISSTFGQRRYFARYDDIDGSQITHGTFINRLATSIGLNGVRGKALTLIQITLASAEPTLIVFDNAETFLDAEKDGGAIADSINEIGALPNVVVLMTSRSTILPPNLVWNRVRVPPLDGTPAGELFRQIYTRDMEPKVLENLLSSVDFHPLSINLLSQVAVQNDWSQQQLVKAWEEQRAGLLETGSGKIRSLSATISLSLKSPSLSKYRELILKLLPVIAFLPQGLDKDMLQSVYPNEPQVSSVVDLLCKHSLTFVKGNFVTMLAPVRLYFNKDFEAATELHLLDAAVRFYRAQLRQNPVQTDWFLREDINMEHLYAHLLRQAALSNDIQRLSETAEDLFQYLSLLMDISPRPTSLRPIINTLKIEENRTPLDYLNLRRLRRRKKGIAIKSSCLFHLGLLAFTLGTLEDARIYFVEARRLLQGVYLIPSNLIPDLTFMVAVMHFTLGNFVESQRILETDFTNLGDRWRPWNRSEHHITVPLMLLTIKIAGGHSKDTVELFKRSKAVKYGPDSMRGLWGTLVSMTMMAARLLGENAKAQEMSKFVLDDEESRFEGHLVFADYSIYGGDAKQAETYLNAASLAALDEPENIIRYYQLLAVCKFLLGNIQEAESIPQKILDHPVLTNSILAKTATVWTKGWIELHNSDLTSATSSFQKALGLSEVSLDKYMAASARRCLGEIAFLAGDHIEASTQFQRASTVCSSMGVVPAFVFDCNWTYMRLDDKFKGWVSFSECKHPFMKEQFD